MINRKKILIGLAVVLVVIQFIRPSRNQTEPVPSNEIGAKYTVPDEIHTIISHSCYDCHSSRTTYPWYANVQPIGWWMQWHVNEGKGELNFSEFATYTEKRAKHKFKEIEEVSKDGSMPIDSYLWVHGDTKLSPEQAKALADWAGALK